MRDPLTSAIAANRFGLGARPGDLETISGDGRGWLLAQLEGSPPEVSGAGLRPSAEALTEVLELRRQIQEARKAGAGGAAPQSPQKVGDVVRALYVNEVSARFSHALASNRPFLERLTQFWTNHFAISVDKGELAAVAGSFEREAIRPNVLGHFAGLLNAVERHPAMLLYLDNQVSTGPNSPAAQNSARHDEQTKVGINENLAREILELHTLGVGGGYTQQDVTTFAYVISGWSVGRPKGGQLESPGAFVFRPQRHEPGPKTVLGKRYLDTGYLQGVDVLSDLATHPSTARFIATKLARHFVADDPPHGVVDQVARAFSKSGGHLPTVYAALIDAPEAWQQPLTKFKTPADYIVSSYRGLNLPVPEDRPAAGLFDQLGQRTYAPGSPAGWPDRSADWDGASALLKRIEWADKIGQKVGGKRDAAQLAADLLGTTLSEVTRVAIAGAASPAQAITLLLAAPEFMRR